MVYRLLSATSGSSPLETIVQLSSAALIVFEHSFYIFDKRRYPPGRQPLPYIRDALEQYMASPHAAAVRGAVSTTVRKYQEAESTAVREYQETVSTVEKKSSTWKAKLLFERSRRKEAQQELSERKAELMKTVLEITLQYRLPRP